MFRVLIGGLMHETNTFNPTPTDLAAFRAREWLAGEEMLARRRGTASELGGFLDVLEAERDVRLVSGAFAAAMPAGRVTDDVLEGVLGALLGAARAAGGVDGVLLALHGAMVTETHDDGEGYLLARLREALGPAIPIVCTLDLHATLTPEMARHASGLVIYGTYPHMDQRERGQEAALLLLRALRGEVRPTLAIAKRPLLIGPPQNVLPGDPPMREIMSQAREMERSVPGVLAACPAHGFMQQDVPWAGVGAAVTTDGDPALAARLAEEIAEALFSHRAAYDVALPDPAEAVRLAATARGPVAIADVGDNIGAGTPGDGTALLGEILLQGVASAFVPLCDPLAARQAAMAGVGQEVTLEVGAKSAPLYGPPVRLTARVRTVTDGVYLNRAGMGYSAGVLANQGLSVRLDAGGLTVVLTSLPMSPNNLMHARSLGVYPEDYQMTVCKGGLAFREAYKPPVTETHILADTPGYSSPNLSRFTYTRVRRPILPLDGE